MKTRSLPTKLFLPLLLILSLLSTIIAVGQQSKPLLADTVIPEIEIINISDISIKSGEVWTQTNRLFETLISDDDIKAIGIKNDSLLDHLSNLLDADISISLRTKNIRYLNNKNVYWMRFADILDKEKVTLVSDITILNEYNNDFENEILIWRNTKVAIEGREKEPTIMNRVSELISQMEGVVDKVQQKSDKLLAILDRTSEKSVSLDEYIDRIDKALIYKKGEIFVRDQPSLLTRKIADQSNWHFMQPLVFFYQMEVVELGTYLDENLLYIVFQVFLIIILIIVFRLIKKKLLEAEINDNSFYKKMLLKIFSRNISAALILGLFASILIYPNRPELFKDLNRLLVTIPLILITTSFIDKKFFKYIYLFGLVIFLQMIYFIYPADNLFSQVSIIVVALMEVIALWSLVVHFYRHPISRRFLNTLLILLILIHFGFALTGFIGMLFGAAMLAEVTTNIPIFSVLSAILVITTVIIINGLIVIGVQSKNFQKLNFIRLYGPYLRTKVIGIINFLAITFWLLAMMDVINIKRPFIEAVELFFTDEIKVGMMSFSLWDIVIFFLIIWLSIIISKMIRILLEQDILNKLNLSKGVPHTIAMMVRYSIITIGVILAVAAAGMPVDNLTVLFGAFGVGIGFGLQNIFNNIVSGFILLFERPIQIGDTIAVGELIGNVKSIGIRSSNVRTFDGAEVIVPNGQLISKEVVNWTLSDQRRRIEIITGVAYGSDPHKVKELLLKVISEHPDVIEDPAPYVYFIALGESSLDFRLLFWTSFSDEWIRIRSEVMFKIHDTLQDEGIAIPFPQRDLHLRSVDTGIEIINKK